MNGSLLLFLTPSALKDQAVASGSGEPHSRSIFSLFSSFGYSPNKRNPDYKGKWSAPMIDNPAYKGVWAPRQIPNPNYFEDLTPVKSLAKIVSLWMGSLSVYC